MSTSPSVTSIQVESIVFPPYVKPPGATSSLFLGGADGYNALYDHAQGVRCLESQGVIMKVTAVALYLEDKAISSLAAKWKGKTAAELTESAEFDNDAATGPFEKLIQITALVPLSGTQFAETSSSMFADVWKANGSYTDADSETIDKYMEVFKDEFLSPGSSILMTASPVGSLAISFVRDNIIPEATKAVLENGKLGPTMIQSTFGINGVSPNGRLSLASRLSDFMNQFDEKATANAEPKDT